jgi:uncharacterized membrane protein
MQTPSSPTLLHKLTRWLVPIAALLVFAGWLYISPPGLLGKADSIGYAVCHRIDQRSFHIGDRQLPLCARCSGTFTAAAVGLVFQAIVSRKRGGMPSWKIGIPLIAFFAAFGLDGSNSYLYLIKQLNPGAFPQIPNLYIPNNTLRLLTGSGMGLTMAIGLYPAFSQTVWKDYDQRPAMDNWRKFGLLLGLILLIDLGILSESPIVLYPIVFISTGGVLALLVMIFSMVWVMIMRQDNLFTSLRQMWLPLVAGFTLAMIMITAIDLLRFQLTGTWGGFPLG